MAKAKGKTDKPEQPENADSGFKLVNQEFDPTVDITSIKPHPQNPNKASDKPVLASIEELGFYGAVVVQKSTRYIIVGSHRWSAKKALGDKTIPVLWVDVGTVEAVRMMLADNRTADLATYREAELTALLSDLQASVGPEALQKIGFADTNVKYDSEAVYQKTYRSAVKTKVGAMSLRVAKVTVGIGVLRFGIASETFKRWYETLETEAKQQDLTIEELVAGRLGLSICQ